MLKCFTRPQTCSLFFAISSAKQPRGPLSRYGLWVLSRFDRRSPLLSKCRCQNWGTLKSQATVAMKVVVFTLLLVTRASCLYPSSPVSGPLAPVSPLHCSVAGKVSCDWSSDRNTHLWLVQVSPLPFCTPALYSPLLPPTGHVWRPVVYIMPQVKKYFMIGEIFCYVIRQVTGPVTLDTANHVMTTTLELAVYWQDFRLIIRLDSM